MMDKKTKVALTDCWKSSETLPQLIDSQIAADHKVYPH